MVRVVFNDHMIWYNFLKKEFSLKSKSNKQNRMLSIVKHWVAHSCRANPIVDLRRRSQDIRCRYAVKGAIFYFFQFEETQHFHRFLQLTPYEGYCDTRLITKYAKQIGNGANGGCGLEIQASKTNIGNTFQWYNQNGWIN